MIWGAIYDSLNEARLAAIDRQLYTPAERAAEYPLSRSILRAMAETFANAFDEEHGLGAPELTDDDYRLAVEYDLLGRPDPPFSDRVCEFIGTVLGPAPSGTPPLYGRSTNDLPRWFVHPIE